MNYRPAKHSELFTAVEKDERYQRQWIEDDVQEIGQRCLGVRRWVQFRSTLTVLARFGYFAINSIANIPTPGEEFCVIKARDQTIAERLLTILLNNDVQLPKEIPKPLINILKDVHLITFYFFSDFYTISKRITGASYVSFMQDEPLATGKWNLLNKLIGGLSAVRLILNLPRQAEELKQLSQDTDRSLDKPPGEYKNNEDNRRSERVGSGGDVICQLCSFERIEPTSTLCGHIFCWKCIHEWLKNRNECPICRLPTEPSRLIHLINFR